MNSPSSSTELPETVSIDGRQIPIFFFAPTDLSANALSIAPLLFSQFRFPEGKVGLDGIRLELKPVIGLPSDQLTPSAIESAHFVDSEGVDLSAFKLPDPEQLQSINQLPPEFNAWGAWITEQLPKVLAELSLSKQESVSLSVTWCYYLQGKIRFHLPENDSVAEQEQSSPFSGWLHLMEENPKRVQPYVCRYTGKAGYDLSVDSEGTIGLSENIQKCSETGQLLIESKMRQCSSSGDWISADRLQWCDCCQNGFSKQNISTCTVCLQNVCQNDIRKSTCRNCQDIFGKRGSFKEIDNFEVLSVIKKSFPYVMKGKLRTSQSKNRIRVAAKTLLSEYLFIFNLQSNLLQSKSRIKWIGSWKDID